MEDKIVIPLSAAQRELLLKYEPYFVDPDLFRLISVAVKKGKHYEIYLDEDQLGDLLDQISEWIEEIEDRVMQDKLDALCDYLSGCYDQFEEVDDFSGYSENTGPVYLLKVVLEGDPKIWRTIAIRGGQTLHDLHNAIFDAFDREEEHLYSFFIPDRPHKKRPRRIFQCSAEYTHPYQFEEQDLYSERNLQDASRTSIDSLGLAKGQTLYYLFDFGDEWWHEITVEQTDEKPDEDLYPRIAERKGKSPPQYFYPDEEEEDWEEDYE